MRRGKEPTSESMLTKRTAKNQITLPAALLKQLPAAEYFDATVENGTLVLRPVRVVPAVDLELIRDRLVEAGVTERDVPAAIRWARDSREVP